SAFFSSTETALMSLNRYRLRHRANSGQRSAKLAEQLLEHRREAAHPDQLLELILVVLEVEVAALLDLGRDALGLLPIDLLLHLLDEADHVAHAEDPRREPLRNERLQRIQLLAGADELDRHAGDLA